MKYPPVASPGTQPAEIIAAEVPTCRLCAWSCHGKAQFTLKYLNRACLIHEQAPRA